MRKYLSLLVVTLAAFALLTQTADARKRAHVHVYKHHMYMHHGDSRVSAVALGAGVASTAAYLSYNNWHWNNWNNSSVSRFGAWGITTVGCIAIAPMVATVVVNRPLTMREGHVLAGSCVVPIVGGWLVNAAYDANPQWEPGRKHYRHHRRHHRH